MIVRLKDLRKENYSQSVWITELQRKKKIRKLYDKDGYVSFSTDDYDEYKRGVKMGRPKGRNNE